MNIASEREKGDCCIEAENDVNSIVFYVQLEKKYRRY